MANPYTPERLAGETFDQYRERRADGNARAQRVAGHGLSGGITSRQQFRDSMRKTGTMGKRTRAYKALMAAFASKRVTKPALRDDHGAYTLVGGAYTVEGGTPSKSEHVTAAGVGNGEGFYSARRIWLAGISAQRGF